MNNAECSIAESIDRGAATGVAFAALDVEAFDIACFDVGDDALERAGSNAEGRAITVGYCTHWYYCGWPL